VPCLPEAKVDRDLHPTGCGRQRSGAHHPPARGIVQKPCPAAPSDADLLRDAFRTDADAQENLPLLPPPHGLLGIDDPGLDPFPKEGRPRTGPGVFPRPTRTRGGRCRPGRTDDGSLRLLAGSSPFFPVPRHGTVSLTGSPRFRPARGDALDLHALLDRPGPFPGIRGEDCRVGSLPGAHLPDKRGGSRRNFRTRVGGLFRRLRKYRHGRPPLPFRP
jgi:hypothetical protein